MSLELTSDEAKALDLGFRWGQITRAQITQIADELIVYANRPPSSEICELAVLQSDGSVLDALSKFGKTPEKWPPFDFTFKEIPSVR